jgi:hypothetical protein
MDDTTANQSASTTPTSHNALERRVQRLEDLTRGALVVDGLLHVPRAARLEL